MALATGEAWKKHPLQVNIPLQVRQSDLSTWKELQQ